MPKEQENVSEAFTQEEVQPRRLSPGEIESILAEQGMSRLIGVLEDAHIEFKEELNQSLQSDKHKLAKAIAGMANASGGSLIIGVRTGKSPRVRRDFAVELTPINEFDSGAFHNCLNELLYPTVRTRLESVAVGSGMIILAFVEPLGENGPTLVTRTVDEDLVGGAIFGLYHRTEEGTAHLKPADIHALIKTGQRLQELGSMRDSLGVLISEVRAVKAQVASLMEKGL